MVKSGVRPERIEGAEAEREHRHDSPLICMTNGSDPGAGMWHYSGVQHCGTRHTTPLSGWQLADVSCVTDACLISLSASHFDMLRRIMHVNIRSPTTLGARGTLLLISLPL